MKREDEIKKILDETEKLIFSPQDRQIEISGIVNKANALTPLELKQKNEEHEKLKIHLLGGGSTSVLEHKTLIANCKQPYAPIFTNDNPYYTNAFRLIGIDGNPKEYIKDKRVRRFTMDTIYNALPPEVLKELKDKNPFLVKILRRKYKLFQYLNAEGRQKVLDLRNSVNEISEDCKSLYEFQKVFGPKHGVAIQLRLYED